MAAALEGQATNNAFGSSCSVTYSSTEGNLLTVVTQVQLVSGDITGVTDSAGNTWSKAASSGVASQKHVELWYCEDADAVTSVTVTYGASVNGNVTVQEWSGGLEFRAANHQSNSSSTTPAACVVSTVSGDLVLGGIAYLAATSGTKQHTAAVGTTALDDTYRGTTIMGAGYKIASATGTGGPAWTMSPSVSSAAVTASFGLGNSAPTADAGDDQDDIEPWSTVVLNGSGSDSDGTIASYEWTQSSGPTVTLVDADTPMPTFVAPATTSGTTVVLDLVVTDNSGAESSADSVTITVLGATEFWLDGTGTWQPLQPSFL